VSGRRHTGTWAGLGAGAALTVAAIVAVLSGVPGGSTAPSAPPTDANLEIFVEHESMRGSAWPAMNRAASLLSIRLPEREGDADRLLLVKGLAARHGVTLVGATFDPPRAPDGGGVTRAEMRATVAGGADAVRALLRDLESAERLLLVEGFAVTRAPEGAGVRADLRLGFPMRPAGVDLAPFSAALREG